MAEINPYKLAAELLKDRVTCRSTHPFFPEYIDIRLREVEEFKKNPEKAPNWREWSGRTHTQSMCVNGLTKAGNPVVAFVHEPHYFSVPENLVLIPDLMKAPDNKTYNSAPLPEEEWKRILERDSSGKVFITDYKNYQKLLHSQEEYDVKFSSSCDMRSLGTVEEIVNNPVIYGLFGGNKTRCRKYLRLKSRSFTPSKDLYLWQKRVSSVDKHIVTLISAGMEFHEGTSGGWDSCLHESNYSPGHHRDGPIVESTFS